MKNMYFTGIGSEITPKNVCDVMSEIGKRLQSKYILRSGGAIGADLAFEKYVNKKNKCIYTVQNFDYSEPNYSNCKSELLSILDKKYKFENYNKYCQTLLLRDINQVLGSPKTSLEKSKFLICWTIHENYNDSKVGGSRFAIRCALKYGIKVYNLVNDDTMEMVKNWLKL